MRIPALALLSVLTAALFLNVPRSSADTLKFVNGTELEGVIKKVEAGNVYVVVGEEEKIFSILEIASMDFNTPHLAPTAHNIPIDHFLKSIEAQIKQNSSKNPE